MPSPNVIYLFGMSNPEANCPLHAKNVAKRRQTRGHGCEPFEQDPYVERVEEIAEKNFVLAWPHSWVPTPPPLFFSLDSVWLGMAQLSEQFSERLRRES